MRTMTLAISSAESDVSACDCFMTHRTTRARRPHAACTSDDARAPAAWARCAPARAHCAPTRALHGQVDAARQVGGVSPTYLHDEGHVPHIPARSMERADALGLVSLEVPAAPRVPTVGYRLRACMQGCARFGAGLLFRRAPHGRSATQFARVRACDGMRCGQRDACYGRPQKPPRID